MMTCNVCTRGFAPVGGYRGRQAGEQPISNFGPNEMIGWAFYGPVTAGAPDLLMAVRRLSTSLTKIALERILQSAFDHQKSCRILWSMKVG